MARELISSGLQAGTIYHEVWIRDFNTFIECAYEVLSLEQIREPLFMFFKFQGKDGNIIDGYIPKDKINHANVIYQYRYSESSPQYAGHKNTVITDQESSLVQAIYKYIQLSNDTSILTENIDGIPLLNRLKKAMKYILSERFSKEFGLIWSDTTIDWGDIQPNHELGVLMDENSNPAISIYINAMYLIALNNLIEMIDKMDGKEKWVIVRDKLKSSIRKHLWDSDANKFIPHIYLDISSFPINFDENSIYFHGGTAVAIEAGLLSENEIKSAYQQMVDNKKSAGAQSIGITIYPPYPKGYFQNPFLIPFEYHNGGDWTWWGGRMVQQLIQHGMINEAIQALEPMIDRVINNNGFYEWYSMDGEPHGAGYFRGSAGVLYKAIEMMMNKMQMTIKA